MNATPQAAAVPVELDDVQGVVRFGYGHLPEAQFLLLRIRDAAAARRWLADVRVTSAVAVDPLPDSAVQVALTAAGLAALGASRTVRESLSAEFLADLGTDAGRARRLGDVGDSAPERWGWGGGEGCPTCW